MAEKLTVFPSRLGGEVTVPPSKSYGHRLLIAAALCDRPTAIIGLGDCDDIRATADCLRTVGTGIGYDGSRCIITPRKGFRAELRTELRTDKKVVLDCGQSGSTARFLLPVVAALGINARMVGSGRLPERPMLPLTDLLRRHGVTVSRDNLPLDISGKLCGDGFEADGSVSSQFISGLLFALPLLGHPCTLRVTGKAESVNYIDMTVSVLRGFGADILQKGNTFEVNSGFHAKAEEYRVEGDWSAAAFWMAAGAVGGKGIKINGLSADSLQGDRAVCAALAGFGAEVTVLGDSVTVQRSRRLHSAVIDCKNIPDLVPALAVAAAYAEGESIFRNISRLRIKESDRVEAVISMLSAFGIGAYADTDCLHVTGGHPHGGVVNSFGDHRIAMAAAVCAAFAEGESVISEPGCASKSYPDFFTDFAEKLGGKIKFD